MKENKITIINVLGLKSGIKNGKEWCKLKCGIEIRSREYGRWHPDITAINITKKQ